jgi:hypothetical protein
MFTSRTAESYDPQSYIYFRQRYATAETSAHHHDPRPDFEPTRDQYPYVDAAGYRYSIPEGGTAWIEADELGESGITEIGPGLTWAPRDRNRNRILIDFRSTFPSAVELSPGYDSIDHADSWLNSINERVAQMYYTPAEIEHARRVLTLLVALTS